MSVNEGVWTTLLPAPKDYGYNVSFTPAIKVSFNGKQGDAPILTGYDPKEWKEDLYIGNNTCIKASEIFIEDARIGIDKNIMEKQKKMTVHIISKFVIVLAIINRKESSDLLLK